MTRGTTPAEQPADRPAGQAAERSAGVGGPGFGRWATVAVAAVLAVVVFGVGYSCTGSSAPKPAKPAAPQPAKVTVPSQKPEPSEALGALPADRTAPATAACAARPRPAGWVKTENAKPGDAGWRAGFAPDTVVNGYLGEVSAACGDTVDVHLSGYVPTASLTAYRMGWYGGAGGRVVWSTQHVPVSASPVRNSGAPTYTVEASWPTATVITITPDWTPGLYLVVARAQPHDPGDAMPLVIRDDSDGNGKPGTGSSPLLFQTSLLTYQAYNTFGRYSLYNGPKDLSAARSDRSRVASFDRPYAGSGYEAPFLYDVPLAAEIEKQGLDVDYTTDIDVDQRPSQVPAHKALVIGGHSEYWTRRMYDTAQYARDHGVNLAFFGANVIFWHARLEPSPAGPDRRMVVYRVAKEDPLAKTDPSQATTEWQDAPLFRPEAALVGAAYGELGSNGGAFRVLQPNSWVFAGTGATKGQVLKNSLGGEFDSVKPELAATPPDVDVLAAAPVVFQGTPMMATMSYYSAPSGAGVFSGGMTFWPCQVGGSCKDRAVDPATAKMLAAMTDNVLRAFSVGPAGTRHPSTRRLAPTAPALISSAAAPADVGVWPK